MNFFNCDIIGGNSFSCTYQEGDRLRFKDILYTLTERGFSNIKGQSSFNEEECYTLSYDHAKQSKLAHVHVGDVIKYKSKKYIVIQEDFPVRYRINDLFTMQSEDGERLITTLEDLWGNCELISTFFKNETLPKTLRRLATYSLKASLITEECSDEAYSFNFLFGFLSKNPSGVEYLSCKLSVEPDQKIILETPDSEETQCFDNTEAFIEYLKRRDYVPF